MKSKTFILLITFVIIPISIIFSQNKNLIDSKGLMDIDDSIKKEMKESKIPSLSAAIINKDGEVWKKSYGIRNTVSDSTNNETIYLLSSISKLVVAISIMQQVEKGKISLDTDINQYLSFKVRNPYYPNIPITTRMLMTHQTGLSNPNNEVPGVNDILSIEHNNSLYPWVKNKLDSTNSEYTKAIWKNKKPGSVNSSSNFGITLLAHLVEAVSNESFDAYTRKNIFEPLEMYKTGYRVIDTDLNKLAVMRVGENVLPPFKIWIYPAGQLWSSVDDWSNFIITFLNDGRFKKNRILKSNSIKEMLSIKHPNANMAYGAGLGLIWRSYGDHKWLGHTGGGGLVTGSMDINLNKRVGVVIFTNARRKFTVSPVGNIYKLLHKKALELNQQTIKKQLTLRF